MRSGFDIWHLFRMLKGAALRCPLVFSSATEHKSYVTVIGVTTRHLSVRQLYC
jgi:hypothetical protein